MNKSYNSNVIMTKQKRQFQVIFTPQKEGGFTAEVLELPGCISEGENMKETEKNIQEAIELYLETLEEQGLSIPKPSQLRKVLVTM